jgi:chaperonin GroES
MQSKEGDVVVYPKYGAKEIEIDGEDYLIIRERELLTIIDR